MNTVATPAKQPAAARSALPEPVEAIEFPGAATKAPPAKQPPSPKARPAKTQPIRKVDAGITPKPVQIEAHLRKLDATMRNCQDTINKVISACNGGADFLTLLTLADKTLGEHTSSFSTTTFTESTGEAIHQAVLSAAALVGGAISLAPGEDMSIFQAPLLDVYNNLDRLLEDLDCVKISPFLSPAPTEKPQPAHAIEPPHESAYTAKQSELALKEIALMAATVRDFLRAAINESDDESLYMTLMAVSQIGSIADQVGGLRVIGGPADWSVGQSFRMVGAA